VASDVKGVNHISQAELATAFEHIGHINQSYLLPEIGQMVKRDLGNYCIDWSALMPVGQKASLQELDIGNATRLGLFSAYLSMPADRSTA
jgi:hypothetical protein